MITQLRIINSTLLDSTKNRASVTTQIQAIKVQLQAAGINNAHIATDQQVLETAATLSRLNGNLNAGTADATNASTTYNGRP